MELTGRIIAVMEAKSGKSAKTGNPWMIYAMGESNDYQKIRETYKEVQNIVDEDPNRLLGETKKILEQRVKQDKKNKMQYAVLFAAAVIEWYLKHH